MPCQIVLLSEFAGRDAARTSITIPWNNEWKVGDVIYGSARLRNTAVTPTMTGWDVTRVVNTTSGRAFQQVLFTRQLQPGDGPGSSWTLSWGGTSITCSYVGEAIRGAPDGSVIDGTPTVVASTTTVLTLPTPAAIRTAGPGMAIWIPASYQTASPNQPAQWFYGCANAASDGIVEPFQFDMTVAGSTPNPASTKSTADAWTSIMFVIKDGVTPSPSYDIPTALDGIIAVRNGGWGSGFSEATALRINYVRVDIGFNQSFASTDNEFIEAAAAGIKVLPVFVNYTLISAQDSAAAAAYVASFVSRYGPGGTFWTHRNDGHLAPTYFEVLNEPYGTWFYGTVEAGAYARFFKACVVAGRAANPRAKYLLAGVDAYYQSGWHATYVSEMFTAVPDLADFIDGVTFHLYGIAPLNLADWVNYGEWPQVVSVLSDLWSRGARVRGWITEWGFTTTTDAAAPNYGVSEANQAAQITAAMMTLFHGRWREYIAATMYYRYRDGVTDTRENRWGINNNDNSRKPGWTAFQTAVAATTRGPRASPSRRYPSRASEMRRRTPARR